MHRRNSKRSNSFNPSRSMRLSGDDYMAAGGDAIARRSADMSRNPLTHIFDSPNQQRRRAFRSVSRHVELFKASLPSHFRFLSQGSQSLR